VNSDKFGLADGYRGLAGGLTCGMCCLAAGIAQGVLCCVPPMRHPAAS
jgi:F0F1-type ATP synthase membrane subunit c/vacuolar-type H+-ATPase subunit K